MVIFMGVAVAMLPVAYATIVIEAYRDYKAKVITKAQMTFTCIVFAIPISLIILLLVVGIISRQPAY
jgi:hypothetical protein